MLQPIRLLRRGSSNGQYAGVIAWCSFVAATLAADRVAAQELDYGKYEGLFGESVTMSATGKPERVSDTPVLMEVITAQDIQRSGARDIPTLLRRMAGVDLTHASTNSVELGIGGYLQTLGSRAMVLINGRQVYFDGFGDVFWSALPVELAEIRQIEVTHGPQSALYGFNAVDGVINIVTFDPVDDPVNSVTARVGNHARRDLTASVTQSLGEGAGIRISAASDHTHDFGMIPNSPGANAFEKNPNRRSASFNTGFTLPDGARLGLEASHTDVTERSIVYGAFYNARIIVDSVKASYTADTGVGHLNATGYFTGMQTPWVQTEVTQPFRAADRAAVGQVSDVFKIGPSDSVRIGGELRHDEMSAGNLTYGTLTGDLGAGSAMWEHRFSPALSSVNAIRYDYFKLGRNGQALPLNLYTNGEFDRSVQGFSVNSALIDKISDVDTLRLSFARGLKLPSLADFGQVLRFQYSPQSPSVYSAGNPDLAPSAVYDYQAGWDRYIADLDATNRLSIFHQMTMHHVGSRTAFVDGAIVQLSTMGAGSVANGVEWGLRHKAKDGWTWGVNYTFERLHEHADLGYQDSLPVHKVNGNIGYAWTDWDIDLNGGYTSATKGAVISGTTLGPVQTIKGFTTLAPRLAWHGIDHVTVELVADNMWSYRDSISQRMDAGYYLSVRIAY